MAMPSAAIRMSAPSAPLEKYSALSCPYGWSSSSGRAATVSMAIASIAPARFTSDSSASDNSPTEPVSAHAQVLSPMVTSAASADSHA